MILGRALDAASPLGPTDYDAPIASNTSSFLFTPNAHSAVLVKATKVSGSSQSTPRLMDPRTQYGPVQDVQGGVVIARKDQAAGRTLMRPHG